MFLGKELVVVHHKSKIGQISIDLMVSKNNANDFLMLRFLIRPQTYIFSTFFRITLV